MARDIRKPAFIREQDVKDVVEDVVIDVTPRKEEELAPVPEPVQAEAVAEHQAVIAAVTASVAPDVKLISFSAWFQKVLAKNPRVRLSYKEAIEAHCRAVGLGSQSTEDAYEAALSHFGL